MTKYAHVKDGAVLRIKDLTAEEIAAIPAHKASYILPYITVPQPVHDSVIEYAAIRQSDIITATEVTQAWQTPILKTAGELDADKNAIADTMDVDPFLRAFALAVLDEFNLLRDLHSLAPRTAAQLKAAVKGKL